MQDTEQKPPERGGHFPYDLRVLLEPIVILPLILFFSTFLPGALNHGGATLFIVAMALGIIGVVLLFLARLPLYRQRRFFAFGPRHLTGIHKKLYYTAYAFIIPSVILLIAMVLAWR